MAKSSKELKAELKQLESDTKATQAQEAADAIKTKIRTVRFYQSVQFEKKLGYKQLSYNMELLRNRKDVTMELNESLGVIEIKSPIDHVMVPLANVAFIQMFTEVSKAEAVKNRAALG